MTDLTEINRSIAFVRASLEVMERDAADQPSLRPEIVAALSRMVSASLRQGLPPPNKDHKKPPRGLGYGQMGKAEPGPDGELIAYTTADDAMVVASLPWFKGNWSAAVRAQYPKASPEEVRNHADRIRGHQAKIIEFEGNDRPWETSDNWLGDLIKD